ncbi:GNVR domain-containing protein [Granulicella sp. L60]|uniref:GumC family protein n=1 Tax=Granulicella sp. L60 TaxID=1641866 RepID=UPI00131B5FCE|nr:GNVR domain-containing protein [Granulicella sp. L60]
MNQRQVNPDGSSMSIRQCLEALKKHGHIVFLSSLLLAVFGIVGVSLLPDVYRAKTTILVDPQKIPERYVASTVTSDPNARMNTLTQQVLSTSRLQEIVDKNNLYPDLRKKWSREEVIEYMRQKTTIELKLTPPPEQGLSSFSISYEDEDRSLVANIANQLASSFIDWNLKVREQQALGTSQFLSTELGQARKSLEEQEGQLEDFRMKHSGATPDQVNSNLQALSRLQADVQTNADTISRLDQERILLAQVKPTEARDTASLTERGRMLQEKRRLDGELWNLKRQFTDTYPDVIAATEQLKNLNARLAAMPEPPADSVDSYDSNTQVRLTLIDKELQRRKLQQAALQQQIQSYQGKVDSVPVLETQLAELTRNYEVSRQNYQSLLDKTFSAGMSEELERKQQGQRFTVLDTAKTPEKPIKPDRILLMAGVMALALLLPAGITICIYLMSGSIKSEAELKGMLPLKIQVLGTIPPITSRADLHRGRMITVQTVLVSVIACTALVIFLLKVRPIL